jgi:hypothetical protein
MAELREYSGDFEDVAELARRVGIPEYGGKTWLPLPDAATFRRQFGAQNGARCTAAYEGTKLVGSGFSFPHQLRIGARVHPIELLSCLNVDPGHRRVALPMVERLRRDQEERGLAFSIGVVAGDPASVSYRFWTKYAQTFPQNFRFLFRAGYWIKVLAPRELAQASLATWERLATTAAGPLLRLTPYRHDPDVRDYRAGDIERCAQLLENASASLDWALVWSPRQLASQIANPASATLVLERDGRIRAMVNYRCLTLHGRKSIRAALLDLWADELNGRERVRLLGHVCNHLRARDVHLVLALRCALMPATAFLANLFVPAPGQFHVAALTTPRTVPLASPKTWSLVTT